MASPRVCVIGAGAAGLCTARHLAAAGRNFQVLEQAACLGGTWVYSDNVDCHSSMYYNLRTNFPKELMSFMQYPFKEGIDSFAHHTHVLAYLQEFAREFDLHKHIKFNTRVENVRPVHQEDGSLAWAVTTEDLTNHSRDVQQFDVVMVCNGHYSKPFTPHIPGLDTFKGINIHSHNYRRPEMFAGLTVLIVGASFSGVDIAVDIHTHALQVLVSHADPPPLDCSFPENVERVPKVRSVDGDSFTLEDGSTRKADAIILCTGYEYDFPFLDPSCNVTVKEGRVTPLYKHFIHIHTPSLALIGLPYRVYPFLMFDIQVQFFLKVLDKEISLPSEEDMEKDSEDDFQKRLALQMPARHAHQMGNLQWEYFESLGTMYGGAKVPAIYKNLLDHTVQTMKDDFITYKDFNYKIVDDENFIQTN